MLLPLPGPCLALVATSAVLSFAGPARAQDEGWPGFRGPTGSGAVDDAIDPTDLAPRVLWRARIGTGYSGVAIAGNKAITMFEDGDQYIIALDATTGEELWRRRTAEAYPGRDGSWSGPISTPVVHGRLVVALEPWGRLFALDATDGEPVWSVHLAHDLGARRPAYGFGSSPLVVDGTLVVHGGEGSGTVLGFDVATGDAR